jgi:peptide deformylase
MIITDENLLRVDCELVLPDEINNLRSKLEVALDWSARNNRPGIGLACPQIGIAKQMVIIRIDNIKLDLVNAKISEKYHQFEFDGEGCLSFPGRFEKTLRHREVVVEGNLVKPHRFIATGLVAIVIQHELDHLSKTLLPDIALKK